MSTADPVTRSALERRLHRSFKPLLSVLPEESSDNLDRFILEFIDGLSYAILGSGFDAIQAKVKLDTMNEMTYAQLREAASLSPDYPEFERKANAC